MQLHGLVFEEGLQHTVVHINMMTEEISFLFHSTQRLSWTVLIVEAGTVELSAPDLSYNDGLILFLGALAKQMRKATNSLVMSVCLPVCMKRR